MARRFVDRIRYLLSQWRHTLRDLETHRAFRRPEDLVRRHRQRLDDLAAAMAEELRRRFERSWQRLRVAQTRVASFDLRGRPAALRRRVEQRTDALRAALERVVARRRRRFSAGHVRFASIDLRARVGRLRRRLDQRANELQARADRLLVARRRRWEAAHLRLHERSPYGLLQRGYAIAYDAAGNVLRSADQVELGDAIAVQLARGELGATVNWKKEK